MTKTYKLYVKTWIPLEISILLKIKSANPLAEDWISIGMELSKKYLHDRLVLVLITLIAILLVIGVSVVLLRFDVSKNPTTTIAYRPSISGSSYQSGKPIDIYSLAFFMVLTAAGSVLISSRIYTVRRSLALFLLAGAVFLLILATIVANSLISLQ